MKNTKLFSLILCLLAICLCITACGESEPIKENDITEVIETPVKEEEINEPEEEEGYQIINPVVEYDTLEDAVIHMGHLSPIPSIFSRADLTSSVAIISDSIIQIKYYEDDVLFGTLREKAGTDEDISGNYNEYKVIDSFEYNSFEVTVKGYESNSYSLIIWNDGAYAHSIDLEAPVTMDYAKTIVAEMY